MKYSNKIKYPLLEPKIMKITTINTKKYGTEDYFTDINRNDNVGFSLFSGENLFS
jgi:hypothetical protein